MGRLLKTFLPKTCDEFATDLVLYAYDKIAPEERVGIEAHLDACASCRDRQDQLLQELATAPLDFPPPQFWDDYSREMQQKLAVIDEEPPQPLTWLTPFSVRGITAMAAGAVLVVALGLALKDSLFSSGDGPQGEAMMEVLPIVQNLEFFESMHYLEMMDSEPDRNIKSSRAGEQHGAMIASIRASESRGSSSGGRYSPDTIDGGALFAALQRPCLAVHCRSRRPNIT